ncbi:MAG: metallophosphoesterase family protein [Planctomycetota bacterium]
MRRFVIGDIHGCSKALRTLIETIDPQSDDELVFLGDYVDRGPDSKGVIAQLIELKEKCRVVALRGNHEIMLWSVAYNGTDAEVWLESGGRATVTSYGGSLEKIPDSHRDFIRDLLPHYETDESIFVHACYEPSLQMDEQGDALRYWTHLGAVPPEPHCSGKRVFVGHTPQANGDVLDLGHLVCMDTYCFGTGYLTGLDLATNEVIQVDRKGFRRRVPAQALLHFVSFCVRSIQRKFVKRETNATHD